MAQSLVRGLNILFLFSSDRPALTVKDIARGIAVEALARPLVKKLASASGETAQFTLLRAGHGVCVVVEESRSTLRVAPGTGRALPLHAGASVQSILAFLPEAEQLRILARPLERFTPRTLTDAGTLARRLRVIRHQGYAVSRAEVYPGALGIAAPVFDAANRAIGSLAISGPEARMATKRRALTEEVVTLAREFSAGLGWRPPTPPR